VSAPHLDHTVAPPKEHLPPARRLATFTSGLLLMLGILTMLRSGYGDWDVRYARQVILWPGHFLTGVAQGAIGIVGVYCATRESLARGYLATSGLFLLAWAVAGIALDGEPNDVFTADPWLVGIHLVIGAVSVGVAARSAARHTPAATGGG